MSSSSSPNGLFTLPAVASAVDADLWGAELNTNFNTADSGYTTRTLDLDNNGYFQKKPILKQYGETWSAPASAANVITLDLSNGNHFKTTLTENITTITISNLPTAQSGSKLISIIWYVKQNGTGSWTITFPAAVKWSGGTSPTITTTAAYTDKIILTTTDGGTTYDGQITQNYSGL